jgi:hypothetical protein
VVLLDFWATWCTGCKVEIPWFIEFDKAYRAKGLAAVGVAMDDEGWKKVEPYLKEHPISYTVVAGNFDAAGPYGITRPAGDRADRPCRTSGRATRRRRRPEGVRRRAEAAPGRAVVLLLSRGDRRRHGVTSRATGAAIAAPFQYRAVMASSGSGGVGAVVVNLNLITLGVPLVPPLAWIASRLR